MEYIVAIVCALISGLVSFLVSRSDAKNRIQTLEESNKHEISRLMKQHELDLENLKIQHDMEMERLQATHRHEIELIKEQAQTQMASDMFSGVFGAAMKSPAMKKQLEDAVSKGMANAGKKPGQN